jgi:hypothetical protein
MDLTLIQKSIVELFPEVKKCLEQKQQEGFVIRDFQYRVRHFEESLTIILYEQEKGMYEVSQAKGSYAGGYSHLTISKKTSS